MAPSSFPPTCHATCLRDNNTCGECGRPNCWGDRCQHCAGNCWRRKDITQNTTHLFSYDQKHTSKVFCNGLWERLWRAGDENNKPPRNTPNETLVLHLVIIYVDGRELVADFDSVVVKNNSVLSVGNLIADEGAGNWWEAPFSGRSLRSFPDTNCYKFYTPNDTCVSLTTMDADKQLERYNGTVLYRGYPWLTGDENYDTTRIKYIDFWMTCAECQKKT